MKTLEFKLNPNKAQVERLEHWLNCLVQLWNYGLALLEESEQRDWRAQLQEKHKSCGVPPGVWLKWGRPPASAIGGEEETRSGVQDESARLGSKGRKKRGKKDSAQAQGKKKPARLRGSGIVRPKHTRGVVKGPYCKIRQYGHIEDPKKVVMGNKLQGANGPWPDGPWRAVCSRFRNGLMEDLQNAWKAYKNPKQTIVRRPRYRRRGDIRILTNGNAGKYVNKETGETAPDTVKIHGDRISFPLDLHFTVKGLAERLPCHPTQASILKKASGWYLQLVCPIRDEPKPPKKLDQAVALDPGVSAVITSHEGDKVTPPNYYKKSQKKLRRLQRQASRKWQQNGERKSKNWQKIQQRIARLHEKVARQRRAFNHKLSTFLASEYGGVAIEENTVRNMVRKPKPKARADGKGYERNNRRAKAGLNKALLDVAGGQFREMLKTKVEARDAEFHLVSSRNNSQVCPRCGGSVPKTLKVRVHDCPHCGYRTDRDQAAAQVVYGKAEWQKSYTNGCGFDPPDPSFVGAVKPVAGETLLSAGGVPVGELLGASQEDAARQEAAHNGTQGATYSGVPSPVGEQQEGKSGKPKRGRKPRGVRQTTEPRQLGLFGPESPPPEAD